MGRGLDTDWAEARDSREDELSRLRRLGSSVESEEREEEIRKKPDENNRITKILDDSDVQSSDQIKKNRNDTMNMSK